MMGTFAGLPKTLQNEGLSESVSNCIPHESQTREKDDISEAQKPQFQNSCWDVANHDEKRCVFD